VGELDHRNGNRADNRIENLREATMIEQRHNIKPRTTHGVGRGVSLPPRHKRFQAAITANYQRYYLGSFPTAEEARAAYLEAKSRLHTFQPVPRDE
jgi:hypothetical protein